MTGRTHSWSSTVYRTGPSVIEEEKLARRVIGFAFMIALGMCLVLIGGSSLATPHRARTPIPPCVSHMTPLVEYYTSEICPGVIPK